MKGPTAKLAATTNTSQLLAQTNTWTQLSRLQQLLTKIPIIKMEDGGHSDITSANQVTITG